jgi:AcrR family transcriptional regulator
MSETEGLRERKRRETRRALQMAAIAGATTNGLDGITVEEIAARANVSTRTFFNYFASKEDAVSPPHAEQFAPDSIERFRSSRGPIADDIATLLLAQVTEEELDRELLLARRELIKKQPELLAWRYSRAHHVEIVLRGLVDERLAAEGLAIDPHDPSAARGLAIALTVFGIFRASWIIWASSDDDHDLEFWFRENLRSIVGSPWIESGLPVG